ncbi:MAG: carboxypeptidase-like regulatory domain-containing protein, partial [Planctomycetota bacterium]
GWDQHAAETIETVPGRRSATVNLNLIDDSFIAGRILDPFEESGTYFFRALPAGWTRTDATTETGEIAQTRTASDGSFRLEGLPSGTYDLLVVREPALRHGFDLFEGIESGQDEVLELMTSKKKRARVTLLAAGRSSPVSRMLVMHGRTWLPEGETLKEGEHRVHAPTNWPLSWKLGATGGNVETRIIGALFQSMTTWTPERGVLLEPFDAGWHNFGIQAFDERGEPYAPVWTGPVRLGQGMHTFHFDLIETVDVVGSVAGDSLPWPMYVALVKNGRKIALRLSKDEPAHYVPVGADGRFHLWNAPVGDYEIWVGSAFDLDIGRPKRKQPITIGRGSSPTELTVLW